ncbi:MAG: hypothetical protein ACKN91_00905 [Candidatus Fonsibacter sp.]
MGNIKTKSNKNKTLIYFIIAIVITVIVLIILFAKGKSPLERCADAGHIYIWGEQNRVYINRGFKEKMSDINTFKDFPYAKLFAICDQSQKQYPEKFEEKWGK